MYEPPGSLCPSGLGNNAPNPGSCVGVVLQPGQTCSYGVVTNNASTQVTCPSGVTVTISGGETAASACPVVCYLSGSAVPEYEPPNSVCPAGTASSPGAASSWRAYGTVTLGGVPAGAGATVNAVGSSSTTCGSGVVAGNLGAYYVDVQQIPGCLGSVTFTVNGQPASNGVVTPPALAGGPEQVNLTFPAACALFSTTTGQCIQGGSSFVASTQITCPGTSVQVTISAGETATTACPIVCYSAASATQYEPPGSQCPTGTTAAKPTTVSSSPAPPLPPLPPTGVTTQSTPVSLRLNEGWHIISGPAGSTVTGTDAHLWTFRPGDSAYEQVDATQPLEDCWAYWAFVPAPTFGLAFATLNLAQGDVSTCNLTLAGGQWAMIGSPLQCGSAQVQGAALVLTYPDDTYSSGYSYGSCPAVGGSCGPYVGSCEVPPPAPCPVDESPYTCVSTVSAGSGAWVKGPGAVTVSQAEPTPPPPPN